MNMGSIISQGEKHQLLSVLCVKQYYDLSGLFFIHFFIIFLPHLSWQELGTGHCYILLLYSTEVKQHETNKNKAKMPGLKIVSYLKKASQCTNIKLIIKPK